MANKISVIIEATVDKAVASIKGFRSSIEDADGFTNKFKAGASSAFDTVKANAGAMALGAGAALVAFGVKAVGAFTDVAKEAIDLSTATGLGIEEASRWIGVADDYQVSAEALATGLGKVSKTLDDTKWANYGIATRDASGQARSANDILLDSFDMLSKVDNATQQAAIGQELFGKGYQSLTPILGHTRAEYEKMLGSVEKGQVINAGEAATAEKMRLAQDALGDSFKEITLAAGGLLSRLTPVINLLAKGITIIGDVTGGAINLAFGVDKGTASFKEFFAQVEPHTIKQIGDELLNMVQNVSESKGFIARLADWGSRFDDVRAAVIKLGKESPEAVAGVIAGFQQLLDAANQGDPAAMKLVKDYEITDEHLKSLAKDAIPGVVTEYDKLQQTTKQLKLDTEAKAEADKKAGEVLKAFNDNLAAVKKGQDELNKVVDEAKKAADDYTQGLKDIRDAQLDLVPHTEDLEQATRDLESGYYALQGQEAENVKTQNDHKKSTDEKAQSNRDLASSEHSLVQDMLTTAETYAKSRGDVEGSTNSIKDQINFLEMQKAKYPELAAEIQKYIDKLNNVQPVVDTKVTADTNPALDDMATWRQSEQRTPVALNAHLDSIVLDGETHAAGQTTISVSDHIKLTPSGRYASGTSSARRGMALVGEQGPELVSMGGGEQVFNAQQTAGMLGGAAPVVVHVHVAGTVIAGQDLATMVFDAITDGQRRGAILPWAS